MEIFNYLPALVGIKNSDFTPILAKGTIKESSKLVVHKRLLTKLAENNYAATMVFENELYLLRNLKDINNNEIQKLITTNNSWDIIILNPFNESSSTPIEGYNIIKKINDTSTFFCSYIYIASANFLQKVKYQNLNNIESYVYTDPFLNNLKSSPTTKVDTYTTGFVTDITTLELGDVKYSWHEIII